MASDFAAQQAWAMPSGSQQQSRAVPVQQQELVHNVQQGMNQMSVTVETHRPAPTPVPAPAHVPSRATSIISTAAGDEEFEGKFPFAVRSSIDSKPTFLRKYLIRMTLRFLMTL